MTVHSGQRLDKLDMVHDLEHWKAKCEGKTRYTSRNQAKIKAKEISKRKGIDVSEYHCPWCRKHHIGKTPRRWTEIKIK